MTDKKQTSDKSYIDRVITQDELDARRYKSYEARAKYNPEKLYTRHAKRTNIHNTNPDFAYRTVNDANDRVFDLMEMGYSIDYNNDFGDDVTGRESLLGSVPLRSVGQGVKAIVMKCPIDIYKARQQKKQQKLDQIDRHLFQDGEKFNVDPRSNFQHNGISAGTVKLESETSVLI